MFFSGVIWLVRLQFVSSICCISLYYLSQWCSVALFLCSALVYCPGHSKSVWTVVPVLILSGGVVRWQALFLALGQFPLLFCFK
ncbi:hypothetical protein MtrunA17_Chr5g0426341 [Medicago truncatula]|uniref:Transmembrane protein n=1 Tax=Medicago truncatula TaxID=3880 RepID=A0A396HS37_MEDTR|nr:hypothetical protein MtrunA17_Chr5g0426341 [Medicago truncatula]